MQNGKIITETAQILMQYAESYTLNVILHRELIKIFMPF